MPNSIRIGREDAAVGVEDAAEVTTKLITSQRQADRTSTNSSTNGLLSGTLTELHGVTDIMTISAKDVEHDDGSVLTLRAAAIFPIQFLRR